MYYLSTVSFCTKEYCLNPIMTTNDLLVLGKWVSGASRVLFFDVMSIIDIMAVGAVGAYCFGFGAYCFRVRAYSFEEKGIVYSLKMYCFDDSIDCTLCQLSHFEQNRMV